VKFLRSFVLDEALVTMSGNSLVHRDDRDKRPPRSPHPCIPSCSLVWYTGAFLCIRWCLWCGASYQHLCHTHSREFFERLHGPHNPMNGNYIEQRMNITKALKAWILANLDQKRESEEYMIKV
jgi:hypothetical protein